MTLITENIKRFDLGALLKALVKTGYTLKDVYFKENTSLASRPTLVEDISFFQKKPKVVITVNLGLLSTLPTFFRKHIDNELIEGHTFLRYLNFFNHHVVCNLAYAHFQDAQWKRMQLQYLQLLGVNSTSTLWHLITLIFPDLVPDVKKNPRVIKSRKKAFTLGRSGLGSGALLGEAIESIIPNFDINLRAVQERPDAGKPWPSLIKERLDTLLFPLLQHVKMHLTMTLIITSPSNGFRLDRKSYLGYTSLGSSHSLKIPLFCGYTKTTTPSATLP